MAIRRDIRSGDPEVQFVDLTEKAAKAKIVREGYEVPAVSVDQKKTDFLIDRLVDVTPKDLPRVIGQSIPAGTKVMRGSVVDLVLAPKDAVPFDIFANVHADLIAKPLTFVDGILGDPHVRQVLLAKENADDVTPQEKALLINAFTTKLEIKVDDAKPERTFAKAYDSVRGAVAFR